MTDRIQPLIAGNWKMNGLKAAIAEFEAMLAGSAEVSARADLLVCPPATLLAAFAEKARGKQIAVGAQDTRSGAHTDYGALTILLAEKALGGLQVKLRHGGWVDVDPTNGIVVKDEHVLLGWGRDFSDVSPVRGIILGMMVLHSGLERRHQSGN